MQTELRAYLQQAYGTTVEVSIKPSGFSKGLPLYYSGVFDFFQMVLQGQKCIIVADKNVLRLTPHTVKKHVNFLSSHFGIPVVYVTTSPDVHDIERLMHQQVPFIVPGCQLYLPFLGTIITTPKAAVPITRNYVSLAAQLIVTGTLLGKVEYPITISTCRTVLPYSEASVIAAFNELEYFALARKKRSRHTLLSFCSSGRELWENAVPFFRNPCKHVLGVNELPENVDIVPAGVDALAQRTMLNETIPTEFALQLSAFRRQGQKTYRPETTEKRLQLWLYKPSIFGKVQIDDLSLALTLQQENDERVQTALEEMLENFKW